MNETINNPKHYTNHPSGIECITVTEHMGFCLGNVIKYIWRADLKSDAIEDLKKARWYLDREITLRENQPVINDKGKKNRMPTAKNARKNYEKAKKTSKPGEGKRFKALAAVAKASGAENPEAVAAAIGRKKYGKKKMASMAKKGKK